MDIELKEKFFMNFFENANEAMFIVKDSICIDCNDKCLEVFKGKKEQIIGKSLFDLSPQYQTNGISSTVQIKEFETRIITGISQPFEWLLCRFDGSIFEAEITLQKVECNTSFFYLLVVKYLTERDTVNNHESENETQSHNTFQTVQNAIITANKKGIINSWNHHAEKTFGYTDAEITGKSVTNLMPSQFIEQHNTLFDHIAVGADYNIFNKQFDVIGLHKLGHEIPLKVSISKPDEQTSSFFTIILCDMSVPPKKDIALKELNMFLENRAQKRTVELDLLNEKLQIEIIKGKQIEDRLQKLLQSITDYTYHVTIENNIAIKTTHGEGCFAITGYSVDDFAQDKMLWFKIIHRNDQKIVNRQIRRLMNNKETNAIEHRIINKNGNVRWIRNTYVPLRHEGRLTGYDGLIVDITERILLESKVLNTVIETEEKERLSFSQNLHDSLGPTLSASKALIQLMTKPNLSFDRNEILKDIENLLEECIRNVREISFKLSPLILQNYGLYEAIESFILKIKESTNIVFDVVLDKRFRFGDKIETIVYRILCECINNTIRHSKASKVRLTIFCDNKMLHVEYNDNGIGFNVESKMEEHKGVGLMNMQSRIKSINGNMNIISTKEKGTTIKLQIREIDNFNNIVN